MDFLTGTGGSGRRITPNLDAAQSAVAGRKVPQDAQVIREAGFGRLPWEMAGSVSRVGLTLPREELFGPDPSRR